MSNSPYSTDLDKNAANFAPLSPLTFYGGGYQDHQVLGAFANGQFYLSDDFSIIAGLRWSREEKDAGVTYIRPRPECSVVDGTCPTSGTNPFIPTENNGFTDDNSWSNWSPKLGVQYEFSTGQLYAHWTRGYRSGGYNFRITNATVFETVVVPATGGNFGFDEELLRLQCSDLLWNLSLAEDAVECGLRITRRLFGVVELDDRPGEQALGLARME